MSENHQTVNKDRTKFTANVKGNVDDNSVNLDNSCKNRDRNGKKLKDFYPLMFNLMREIRKAKLNGSELNLWLYCLELDPYGDRPVALPPVKQLLEELEMSRHAYFKARKKLQELGLIAFGTFISNQYGISKLKVSRRETSNQSITDSNQSITDSNQSITDSNQSITDSNQSITDDPSKPLQEEGSRSPQIYRSNSDLIHTLSDPAPHPKQPESEKNTNNENQTANSTKNLSLSNEKEIPSLAEKDIALEKIIPPCSTVETRKTTIDPFWNNRGRNIQQRLNPRNNLAEGEWCVDGKLDPVFHEWFAKKWLEWFGDRYKGDIHAAKADVIAHFYNQPEKLPIRWLQYTGEFQRRYQNAQMVNNSGGYFDEEYEKRLRENTRSLTNQLPSELNPVADKREIIQNAEILEGGNEPVLLNAAHDWKKNIPDAEIVDNVEAYKPYIPPKLPELPADYKKGTLSELRKKLASNLSMPVAEVKDRDRQKIEILNEWLRDPILRKEAIARIMASDNLTYECDEFGEPIEVFELKSAEVC